MLLDFGGSSFFIDLEALEKLINTPKKNAKEVETKQFLDSNGKVTYTEVFERDVPQIDNIDAVKYDLLKMFIEYVIDYESDHEDDTLGPERALNQTPLGYKIVFNTLLKEGIIKEQ